jgi:sulfur carrier protein
MPKTSSESNRLQVTVNGQAQEIPQGSSIAGLLEQINVPLNGSAVELDGEIISKSQYENTQLKDGQRVEVVRLVGGG